MVFVRHLPLVLTIAVSISAAPAEPPAGGWLCPTGGPNEGLPPPILLVTQEGARLAVCADGTAGQDGGVPATVVSLLDIRDPAQPVSVWSGDAAPHRFRVETLGERALRVGFEVLLPRAGEAYEWASFSSIDVACRGASCRPDPERCVLALEPDPDRDDTARAREGLRTGLADSSALVRLTDDLMVQALAGDDRAGWLLDHFEALFRLGKDGTENLAVARDLMRRARDLGCPGLVVDPARGSATNPPSGDGLFHPTPKGSSKTGSGASGVTAPGIGVFSWLVGGRWDGRWEWKAGGKVHVLETYEWGPAQRTIRLTSWSLEGDRRTRLYDGLIFHDPRRRRFFLWNLRGGALAEAQIPKADFSGYEIEDAGTRSVITRAGRDGFLWSLRTRQEKGGWEEVLTTTYRRQPK